MHDYALQVLAETSAEEAGAGNGSANARRREKEALDEFDDDVELGNLRGHPYGSQQHLGSAPRLSGSGRTRDAHGQTKPAGGK